MGSAGCNPAAEEAQSLLEPLDIVDSPALDTPRISVQYILENPTAYVDKRITIAAQIVDIWSPRAFRVIGQQFPANDPLLVVASDDVRAFSAAAESPASLHGTIVRVTGTVRLDRTGPVERALDVAFGRPAERLDRRQGPVFVAERVVLVK